MKKLFFLLFTTHILLILASCKSKGSSEEEQMPVVTVRTAKVIRGDIESEISFNGTTIYLKNNQIVSPISGYITNVYVKYGEEIQKDKVLFEIQTRERKALESESDSSVNIGVVKVVATSDGFINELNINEPGVYVAEGSTLCNIVENKDLMVKVNVPFEYINVFNKESKCKILLTDNTIVNGSVQRILPVMDEVNQTQTVLLKPETNRQLPENLNLIIKFINERHRQAFLVAKSSLMTNETQDEFWVMRVVEDNMAVKIPVKKGIENDSIVEIISPQLNINDIIITEGAYGLPDSTIISTE